MSKVHILVDSPSDLPLAVAEQYNIRVLPVRLTFDGETYYRDQYDMNAAEFYAKLRGGAPIPKTTQITPADFEEIFREEAAAYDEIILLTIGANASGTYQSAQLAKQAVEEDTDLKVHLIDSVHLSYGYAYAAIEGAKVLAETDSAKKAVAHIKKVLKNLHTYFIVETLDYLKKGGRIKTTTAIIGGMLDIRPILKVEDGVVIAVDKVRGEKKTYPKLVQLMQQDAGDLSDYLIYLLSGDADDKAVLLNAELERTVGREADGVQTVGPVIGAHAGPGVLGVLFLPKKL